MLYCMIDSGRGVRRQVAFSFVRQIYGPRPIVLANEESDVPYILASQPLQHTY